MPSPLPDWLMKSGEDVLLHILVNPNASRTRIQGTHGDRLKVSLRSPPVDGAANEELIRLLSTTLKISRSRVHIQGGQGNRRKTLRLEDYPLHLAVKALSDHKVP